VGKTEVSIQKTKRKSKNMEKLKISTAQFENRNSDKAWNLSVIEKSTEKAAAEGSKVVAFHECSITGYTFARKLSKKQMLNLAEVIPEGESIVKLSE
jgi:5-aminopentanamidase